MIDLKNTPIYFEDGTFKSGAVNNVAGYAIGAVSILVDGFTGIVPVGARLSLNGDDRYKVVSTTETSGNTTTIVFTPALAAALTDEEVVIAYGVFVEIKVGEGTITWDEEKPREYKLNRGLIDQVRNGDQVPMSVSIELMYEGLTASDPNTDPPTPEDILKHRGAAADWVSADTVDPCTPYCINIRLDWTPPCTTFGTERVILPKFYYEKISHDPKAGKLATSGKCNAIEAIVSRFSRG